MPVNFTAPDSGLTFSRCSLRAKSCVSPRLTRPSSSGSSSGSSPSSEARRRRACYCSGASVFSARSWLPTAPLPSPISSPLFLPSPLLSPLPPLSLPSPSPLVSPRRAVPGPNLVSRGYEEGTLGVAPTRV